MTRNPPSLRNDAARDATPLSPEPLITSTRTTLAFTGLSSRGSFGRQLPITDETTSATTTSATVAINTRVAPPPRSATATSPLRLLEPREEALRADYLAQERVTTSREVFPFVDETGVHMIEQLLDLDPLLFFGKVSGAFTRLSSSSLANVTSGAGMVPTMIVE